MATTGRKPGKRSQRDIAKKRYLDALKDRVSFKGRGQAKNPGRGWTYTVDGDIFRLEANISGPTKISSSGKSRTIATTQHLYDLDEIGLPGHFVVANFGKRIPRDEHKIDYAAIAKAISQEDDSERINR
jgi:hypothetical protein